MEEESKNAQLLITQEDLSRKCKELQELANHSIECSLLETKLRDMSEELKNEQIERKKVGSRNS